MCKSLDQARLQFSNSQEMFHSEKGLDAMLEGLEPLSERLRFTRRDWELVRSCLASMALVLGNPRHARNVQHLADARLIAEAAAQDEHNVGASGSLHHQEATVDEELGHVEASGSLHPQEANVVEELGPYHAAPKGEVGALRSPILQVVPKPRPTKRAAPGSSVEEEQPEPALNVGWCPQCHCWREECFKPGDWACLRCGQHNYEDKKACSNHRCLAPRQAISVNSFEEERAPTRAFSLWCRSCKKMKSECYKLNDWECPWCGNHNWARKQSCNQCRKMKPADMQ